MALNFTSLTSRVRATRWPDGGTTVEVALRREGEETVYFRVDGLAQSLVLQAVPSGNAGWNGWAETVTTAANGPQVVSRFVSKSTVFMTVDPQHESTLLVTSAKLSAADPAVIAAAFDGVTLGPAPQRRGQAPQAAPQAAPKAPVPQAAPKAPVPPPMMDPVM